MCVFHFGLSPLILQTIPHVHFESPWPDKSCFLTKSCDRSAMPDEMLWRGYAVAPADLFACGVCAFVVAIGKASSL